MAAETENITLGRLEKLKGFVDDIAPPGLKLGEVADTMRLHGKAVHA